MRWLIALAPRHEISAQLWSGKVRILLILATSVALWGLLLALVRLLLLFLA